jgi:hypothetical protein
MVTNAFPTSDRIMTRRRFHLSASEPASGRSRMRGKFPNSTVSANGVALPVCSKIHTASAKPVRPEPSMEIELPDPDDEEGLHILRRGRSF